MPVGRCHGDEAGAVDPGRVHAAAPPLTSQAWRTHRNRGVTLTPEEHGHLSIRKQTDVVCSLSLSLVSEANAAFPFCCTSSGEQLTFLAGFSTAARVKANSVSISSAVFTSHDGPVHKTGHNG